MNLDQLHPKVLQRLNSCPPTGSDVHTWLFVTAGQLHYHFPNKQELADLLALKSANCGRHVPRREIMDAIRCSEAGAWRPKGAQPTVSTYAKVKEPKQWPDLNDTLVRKVLKNRIDLAELWEMSPVRLDKNVNNTEAIIDVLFPGNPLLCVGWDKDKFQTRPRESLRGKLSGMQLIVPSPMSKPLGVKKDGSGDLSQHTEDNTGARRFLVVESDKGDFDQHASKLFYLSQFAPLVLAVHSGGKSLHGWFYCQGQPEDTLKKFLHLAVALGADWRMWGKSQFARMPDGIRVKEGKRLKQRVMYFNPQLVEAAR